MIDYFDQFTQTSLITVNTLLSNYSTQNNYQYSLSNFQSSLNIIPNLFPQTQLIQNFVNNNITLFEPYTLTDNEKIEMVSYKVYATTDYWWIIALINNIQSINDWLLSEEQLQELSLKLATDQNIYPATTYYQILSDANEAKRNILILNPQYISDFTKQFQTLFLENV